MSRRYHLFLLMGLLILTPALVRAQDDDIPPLTETFTVADYDLDFQHPADWEIMGDDAGPSILFSAPIGGTGEPNTSGIAVEGGATLVQWRFIASDASPAAAAQAAAEDFVGADTDLYNITEPLHLTINGHAAAQVDTTSLIMLQRFISMEIDEETAVVVEMLGLGDSVVRVAPITLAMLATVRESGAPLPDSSPVVTPALMQNHLREADQTSFSAPADWFIEETDNFTLLTAPNGVTVGISSEPLPDLDDIVLDTITLISDNLLRQLPGVELSDIEEFEVNNQRAARVTGMDNGIYFGFWAIGLSSEVVGHISVIGPPEDVSELEAIIFAIAETITSGQVETLTRLAQRDTLRGCSLELTARDALHRR
jgi:hypothetical protein